MRREKALEEAFSVIVKSSHTFAEPPFQALSLTYSASADYKHHCERSIFCVSGMSLITFETHQSEEQHDSGPIIVLTRKLQMKFGRIMLSGVLCPCVPVWPHFMS